MERDNKQLDSLAKILEQFDPQDIQKFIASMDQKQKQELLKVAISMLEQNMGGQEKETLNVLLKSLLNKKK